jgi:hypothetical protein
MHGCSSIIVLGDFELAEFAAPLSWLQSRHAVERFHSPQEAAQFLANGFCAGQVIAVSRPGQFDARDIEALHALAPLAPIVALVGTWCDGETRSGNPWSGIPRITWHSWQSAFEQLWGDRPQRRSLWLPRIANDLDRLIAQPPLPTQSTRPLLLMRSRDFRLAESVASAADRQGWQAMHLEEDQLFSQEGADAWIWDLGSGANQDRNTLDALRDIHSQARWVFLQSFPRPESLELVRGGKDILLPKPFSLADLFTVLAPAAAGQGGRPRGILSKRR